MARAKCKNPKCEARTTAMAGFCLTCKSAKHRAFKRIRAEKLLVDTAGGAWWIWDRKGEVLAGAEDTRIAVVIELGKNS